MTEHLHQFSIQVGDFKTSAGVLGVCECGKQRYFRVTTKNQALKEFRERGIEATFAP